MGSLVMLPLPGGKGVVKQEFSEPPSQLAPPGAEL